jgi:hypothetical protein
LCSDAVTAASCLRCAALIDSFQPPLDQGLEADLQNKLADTQAQLAKGKTSHACDKLDDFSRKVSDEASKSDPSITPGQAGVLLDLALRIRESIGCT